MATKYTQFEIENVLKENDVELLSEYINSTTNMKMRCKCGNIFEKSWRVMNRSKKFKCNDCIIKENSNKQKMPYELAKIKTEKLGYQLLTTKEEYVKASEKNKIRCPNGHEYEQILNDLFQGHGCKKCAYKRNGEKQKLNYEYVKNKIDELGFILLSNEYYNIDSKIKVKCKKCGHIFYPTFHNLQKGSGCPNCFNKIRGKSSLISYEERLKYVQSFGYDIITPKNEYKNADTKVILKCDKGHLYECKLHDFYNGNRCPKCNQSKGEVKIKKYLKDNNIFYKEQYKFEDCKAQRKLPFDFYLPDYNLIIEYDGKQHFEISSFFGDIDSFIGIKVRDTIKNIYCKKNNINLIRIPYWEYDNIENILNKIINKLDDTFND